jgi:hypothetical protein
MLTLASFNRWQASGIHLGMSAAIGAATLATMLLVWYPGAYFQAAGGVGLILLMIGVDVVLGPTLTLLVYNPKKRSLRFDLATIALVQLVALAYGVFVMFGARPAYLVFAADRFDLIAANQIAEGGLKQAQGEFANLPLTGPRIVAARKPDDPKLQEELMSALAGRGIDLTQFAQYYVPYANLAWQAAQKGRALAELRRKDPEAVPEIDEAVRKSGRAEGALRYLPVKTFHGKMAVIVAERTGEIAGVIAANPW